jgi:hypothetical protein
VHELIAAIIRERDWEDLGFPTFTAMVQAPTSEFGLGLSVDELRKVIALRNPHESSDTVQMREDVRRLLAEEIAPAKPHGNGPGRGHKRVGGTSSFPEPSKNTAATFIARLKIEDPELARKVVDGTVSPNKAAQLKGYRKPRVVLTSPEQVAAKIKEHMSPEDIETLKGLL